MYSCSVFFAVLLLQLDVSHQKREAQIRTCISYQAKKVERLKAAKENAHPDNNLEQTREFSNAQRKVFKYILVVLKRMY